MPNKSGSYYKEFDSIITKNSITEEEIVKCIKTVMDPEIPVNLYDLGLIYKLEIFDSGYVKIEMTLTAPGCPVAGILPQQVADAAASIDGIGEVEVYLVCLCLLW